MRCGSCGEENREGALICGLCKTLFAPAANASRSRPPPRATNAAGSATSVLVVLGGLAAALAGGAAYQWHVHRPRHLAVAAETPTRQAELPRPARPAPTALPTVARTAATATPPARAAIAARLVEEAATSAPPRLSVSSYWYEGADGYRQAVAEQERSRAPMIVYFHVSWCPYCRKMDAEVLPVAAVTRFLADVVKVRVNPETSPADRALEKQLASKGYPSVYVIPAPGARPEEVSGFTRHGDEALDVTAERFVKACERVGVRQSHNLVAEAWDKSRAGDIAGARGDLDRAIEMDPTSATAYYWHARVDLLAREPSKAIGNFKRSIELDPKDPQSYAALAGLYAQVHQLDDAIGELDRLIDVAPDWHGGWAYATRGQARAAKGDGAGATADFAEACRRGTAYACH
jgi:tetratricopeptide (TPR) repeat protein